MSAGNHAGVALTAAFLELVRKTAVELPEDVEAALRGARDREAPDSRARFVLDRLVENIDVARERDVPLCQDTGTPLFFVTHPPGIPRDLVSRCARDAVAEATARHYLRPNAVDPVTGRNSGNNLGTGVPVIHFSDGDGPEIRVGLILKGGGSENVGAQYSLPHAPLGATRDLEGVRRVVLDAVLRAEGKGCPPGVLGVAIGGDRSSGYAESKRQLLRRLGDVNPNPLLADLERRILEDANRLEIGPLGLGGTSTLLGVKIGPLHRLPACFFVSVTYMCHAFRRRFLVIPPDAPPAIT